MSRRNWSKAQPKSLRNAMELCLDYAKLKHNRSIETVAELMGEVNKWTLYKWIEAGSLPLRLLHPFEHACGIDFVSRWLVISRGKLIIDIPIGRKGGPEDIQALQASAHDAIGAVITFYSDRADAATTLAAVQTAMEGFAWHRLNVEKYHQPELPFDED